SSGVVPSPEELLQRADLRELPVRGEPVDSRRQGVGDLFRGSRRGHTGFLRDLRQRLGGKRLLDLRSADGLVLARSDPGLGLFREPRLAELVYQAAERAAVGRGLVSHIERAEQCAQNPSGAALSALSALTTQHRAEKAAEIVSGHGSTLR